MAPVILPSYLSNFLEQVWLRLTGIGAMRIAKELLNGRSVRHSQNRLDTPETLEFDSNPSRDSYGSQKNPESTLAEWIFLRLWLLVRCHLSTKKPAHKIADKVWCPSAKPLNKSGS